MIIVVVNDESQVGGARRAASNLAQQLGFGEVDAGRVALVATELATNLLKHGGGGEMLLVSCETGAGASVEVLALDQGPGMADVPACMADGYSSAGTAGGGLGAVVRLSQYVDIASWPGVGTGVLARLAAGSQKPPENSNIFEIGVVAVAKPGEEVSGDAWAVAENAGSCTLLVADGLGHGPEAAHASAEAVRMFHRFIGHQPATLLEYIHGGLRATRGAAASIARFYPDVGAMIFAGIGNVAGALVANGDLRRMVSMPGTLGYNVRKIQAFEYSFGGGIVILHSDGLSANWTLSRYPSLQRSDPTLIAGLLYRDFTRHRDDATVLVAKYRRLVA
jgi:anti-sigma regulatory factor (Ser/Thr protein kinase)